MKTKTYFIFIRIVIILICALAAIKIERIIWEFLPHTNFYGDSNINKMPGLITGLLNSVFGERESLLTYSEGDIFQRLFGFLIWTNLIFITVFIINLFKKDFMKNFIGKDNIITGNIKKDGYLNWFLVLIIFPIIVSIFAFLFDTIFYFLF